MVVANIFLLLAMHIYQSIANDATDAFEGQSIIKWIYYAIEILFALAHLIVSMELSSLQAFCHAKAILGTLGFEMLLWMMVSFQAWFVINVAIFNVALLCALRREFLHVQPTNNHPLHDEPLPEVPSIPSDYDPVEYGLDGNDLV